MRLDSYRRPMFCTVLLHFPLRRLRAPVALQPCRCRVPTVLDTIHTVAGEAAAHGRLDENDGVLTMDVVNLVLCHRLFSLPFLSLLLGRRRRLRRLWCLRPLCSSGGCGRGCAPL